MTIFSAIDLVRHVWPERSQLLDIGCGNGEFVRTLTGLGHEVFGCDPQSARIAEARAMIPNADFTVSGAEALPYRDGSFDGALMLQSFHHVPGELMDKALIEALRCIRPKGHLAVIEPVAEGSFFDMLRIVDDETMVRAEAQQALEDACRKGILKRRATYTWSRRDLYESAEAVMDKLLANDPTRACALANSRALLRTVFDRAGEPAEGGRVLLHLTRADVFVA